MNRYLKKYFVLFLALFSVFFFTQTTNAWDGIESSKPQQDSEEVYQISDASQLKWFQEEVNKGEVIDGKLTADIDLEEYPWTAIGTSSKTFKGVFDGDNHKITNFQLNSNANFQGFFGKNEGTIKNVIIQGKMTTNGARSSNGSLVGWNAGGTVFNNESFVEMSITGANGAVLGGIVGQNSLGGIITNNIFSGKIDGYTDTGGAKNVGGIVAFNNNDANAKVYGNINNAELIGAKTNLQTQIGAQTQVGGIVGQWSQTGSTSVKTYIYNNINKGAVSAESTNSYVGGIVGQVSGTNNANIKDEYYLFNNLSLGTITGIENRTNVIIANKTNESYNKYLFNDNYYLAEETNESTGAYTETDLKDASIISKLNSNDGSGYGISITDDIKYISVNNDYPTLKWNEKEEEVVDTSEEDLAYLNEALKDLKGLSFHPTFGTDTNAITMMEKKLESLGYDDIKVSIKSSGNVENVDEDGTIGYFYRDPDLNGTPFVSIPVIYEFAKNTQKVETPNVNIVIHWDLDKLEEAFREKVVDKLDIYTFDDEIADLTKVEDDLKLLQYVLKDNGERRAWAPISWTSSDNNVISIVKPTGDVDETTYGPVTGKIKPGTEEKTVTLTAKIKNNRIYMGEPDMIIEKTFEVTVAPVGQKFKDEMQQQLDDNYTLDKLTDSVTKEKLDPNAVVNDIQFLTPRNTGISDYDNYKFSIISKDEDLLKINYYNGNVYRPLPSDEAKDVEFTVVMKHEDYDISVSKDLKVTIKPLVQSEIDQEITLMEEVKENYFNGINKDNANESKDKITSDLKTFKEVRYDENNNLVWTYHVNDNKDYGIGPVDIDLSRPSEQWNLFKSSNADVIAHETLRLVKQPSVDTKVTIQSILSSKLFAKYAEKYPDNEDFKKLSRQAVSVEVNVLGEIDYNLVGFKKVDRINVDEDSSLSDIEAKLPNEVTGLDKNNNESKHLVDWDLSKVDVGKVGKYTINGSITLADQYQYDGDLNIEAIVNIQSEKTNLAYFAIEKFTIGQGYVVEPIAVEFHKGDSAEDVLIGLLKENKIDYDLSKNYLSSIKNVDTGEVNVPKKIQDMEGYADYATFDDDGKLINDIAPDLGQGSYNQKSGWYYLVDSFDNEVGMNEYILQKGDVVRLQFTLYGGGSDIGWDWQSKSFKMPLKDELTKEVAIINYKDGKEKDSEAYQSALAVLSKYDSTKQEIDAALKELKPDSGKLDKYKTIKKGNYTYYYKLNDARDYDKYKTVHKTSTKTTTWNYRTTGAKKKSSQDIITKKGSKTIKKTYYKYNTKGKLTSGKVYKKNSKNKFVLTYKNTKTYYNNGELKQNTKYYKSLKTSKYTSKGKTKYTSKGKKTTYVKFNYKSGKKNNRLEYKYNKNGQLKSTSKYGKSYRYVTSYNKKGKATKTVRKQYNAQGKLANKSVKVKLRTSF